jgi:hypothetical protein
VMVCAMRSIHVCAARSNPLLNQLLTLQAAHKGGLLV